MPVKNERAGAGEISFALVGCGDIATANARAVAASGVGRLAACVDPDEKLAEDLRSKYGGLAFSSLEEALDATTIDAVIVSTPHHLHKPLSTIAMQAGKHVIVEKPLARTLREATDIVESAREHGVQLSAFFPMRYQPEMVWAKEFITQEGLGRVMGFRIVEHLYKEMNYWTGGSSARSRVAWRGVKEHSGGGVLIMNIIHLLDLVRYLTSLEVERVYCEHDTLDTPVDVEDIAAVLLRLEGRALGIIDASTCMLGDGPSDFRVWGSEGQVILTAPSRYITLRAGIGRAVGEWCRVPRQKHTGSRALFLRAFVEAIGAGKRVPCPGEDGLAAQAIIEAAYESMRSRRPVEVGSMMKAPSGSGVPLP